MPSRIPHTPDHPGHIRRGKWLVMSGVLLFVILSTACSLPAIFSDKPAEDQANDLEKTRIALDLKATELALNATEIAQNSQPSPEQPAVETPSQDIAGGETAPILQGLDADLVWFLSDGTLAIQKLDGTLIPVDIGIPINEEYGMPGSTGPISFGSGKVMVTNLVEPYNALMIGPDGGIEIILAPEVEGKLTAASLSPDGTKIAWLFDKTRVAPNLFQEPACDPADGCVGRVYELYLSDASGQNPAKIFEDTINAPGYPSLELDGWRSDQLAIFLRQNAHLLSPLYPDQGSGLKVFDLERNTLVQRTGDNLVKNSFFSPEGNWIIHINDGDQMIALQVDAPGGVQFLKPITAPGQPYIADITFSPFEDRLFWLELETGDSWSEIAAIDVHTMGLIMVDDETLLSLNPPFYTDDLPFLGPVLNDHFLVINHKQDSKILDTRTKTWVDYKDPELTQPHILIGTIRP